MKRDEFYYLGVIEKMRGSKRYSLNWMDGKKIGKGFLIAVAGGALCAGLDYIALLPESIDFGMHEALAYALISALVNAGRKFVTDYSQRFGE